MSRISVVGGIYHERCIWPEWNHVYGSAGRAAAALSGHVKEVVLKGYLTDNLDQVFGLTALMYGLTVERVGTEQEISFEYVHSLSNPVIRPAVGRIRTQPPIAVDDDVVLRFGMLEGSARVKADRCVYDPQSAFAPEAFSGNGSVANHLAIVGNRSEVLAMTGARNHTEAARQMLQQGAEVVIVKSGPHGAYVFSPEHEERVPAFKSERVWKIGSGDVFAAVFALRWGLFRDSPSEAARSASAAVACYAETMALPAIASTNNMGIQRSEATTQPGRAYLAGPFFSMGQRWLIDEARQGLMNLGLEVFSPVHDVGRGPAEVVAPADLKALEECDRVFAILDGTDSGTIFEVGYARARGVPVYCLSQAVPHEDLKMLVGSDCAVYDDLVTALHHTAWRS